VNTPYVDLPAYVGFMSIVSGRNPKTARARKRTVLKMGIGIKPLKLLVISLIFLVKMRWW
jgi:hypothetical protein